MSKLSKMQLQELKSEPVLKWIKQHNQRTFEKLKSDPRFTDCEAKTLEILNSKDKIPYGNVYGAYYYNYWTDDKHINGVWRRIPREAYLKGEDKWEALLDLDAMNKTGMPEWQALLEEKTKIIPSNTHQSQPTTHKQANWVYKWCTKLHRDSPRAMVALSYGGRDSAVLREFDMDKKVFVKAGFCLSDGKNSVTWVDANTLLVGVSKAPGAVTESGYPRRVHVWQRGQPLTAAQLIYEAPKHHVYVDHYRKVSKQETYHFISDWRDFHHAKHGLLNPISMQITWLPLPQRSELHDVFGDLLLVEIKEPMQVNRTMVPAGSLISLNLSSLAEQAPQLDVIWTPKPCQAFDSVVVTANQILVTTMNHAKNEVLAFEYHQGWQPKGKLPLPDLGSISICSASEHDEDFLVDYSNFLTPNTLFHCQQGKLNPIYQEPSWFDAKGMACQQYFATSKDGTKVPYFVVLPKGAKYDGSLPTLLYAYGGYQVSLTPQYLSRNGRTWLAQGGVFVIANIRGGGEYGPAWHQAALKDKRQLAFDDFVAVAEDLIARKITSPKHLGTIGGSNGGLLVAATMVQRPDLFNAVICRCPLTDMLAYHKLPPGASWIGEYGDPEDPNIAKALAKYSPLQNLHSEVAYPTMLVTCSTEDDRVHPAHARWLVQRLEQLERPVLFFENYEGGHGGTTDNKQAAELHALSQVYAMQQLVLQAKPAAIVGGVHEQKAARVQPQLHAKSYKNSSLNPSKSAMPRGLIGPFVVSVTTLDS